MTDSPIADDYDQYRLLDGEVVEVQKWHGSVAGVTEPGGAYEDKSGVSVSRLTRPTRLHLQCAGDDDSPGGLLEEGDIREGDWVIWNDPVHEDRLGPQKVESISDHDKAVVVCKKGRKSWGRLSIYRLATPAELREADIGTKSNQGGSNEQQEGSLRPPHLPVIEIERLLFNLWEWMLQTDMHIHADDKESLEQALYYVSEYLHKTGQKSYLRKCDLVELWQSFDPGGHPSWLEGDAEGEVADDTQPPPTDTRDTDTRGTRTCPRCPGTSFTVIETVSRQRFATLDTTGRMHCGEPDGEEVIDRRLRCDACQYEWRRERWEVIDG